MSTPILCGIDLGTTNTLAAHFVITSGGGEVHLIESAEGDLLMPSVVHFYPGSKEYCVGRSALGFALNHPDRTFRWVKRYIGKNITWAVEIDGNELLEVNARTISARILKEALKNARREMRLPELPTEAVISVPAYFSEQERVGTKEAAEVAGLQRCRLIEEPTAAIFEFIYELKRLGQLTTRFPSGRGHVLVFDLGGGTFDVSVARLDLTNPGEPRVQIVANNGIRDLGGYNFDMELLKYGLKLASKSSPNLPILGELLVAAEELDIDGKISDREHASLISNALISAEACKQRLSSVPRREITQQFTLYLGGAAQQYVDISRGEFEDLLAPYLARIKEVLQETLAILQDNTNGEISRWEQLDEVILVGGSTRIPAIRDLIQEVIGFAPSEDVRKDLVVAKGAAIQAAIDAGLPVLQVARCTSYDYGIVDPNGTTKVVIPRGSQYPSQHKAKYKVPFSLTTRLPITIVENAGHTGDQAHAKVIKEVSYFHPLLLTGDELEVTCSIDESGLMKVFVEDPRSGEAVESSIKDISMTDDEKAQARQDVEEGISPHDAWNRYEPDRDEADGAL